MNYHLWTMRTQTSTVGTQPVMLGLSDSSSLLWYERDTHSVELQLEFGIWAFSHASDMQSDPFCDTGWGQ